MMTNIITPSLPITIMKGTVYKQIKLHVEINPDKSHNVTGNHGDKCMAMKFFSGLTAVTSTLAGPYSASDAEGT